MLIFISGGVRSGKSSFAERLAIQYAERFRAELHYIAAGQASDQEMKERIAKHQEDRHRSGKRWKTWERPIDLAGISKNFMKSDCVLLDCVTTLLNNEVFHGGKVTMQAPASILAGIAQILAQCRVLIVVSNEVLNEPVPEESFIKQYMKMLGMIHQELARMSDQAYLVENGLPLQMKGAN